MPPASSAWATELISSRQIPMVNALPHDARFRASNRGRLDTSSVPPQPRATQCCGLHFDRGASCTGVWVSPRCMPIRREIGEYVEHAPLMLT